MQEEDFDKEIKVLVIGNGGVGKTSMIRRFCKGIYTDEYKKTIGVDFLEKAVFVDTLGGEVRFMLWDTAGQEEFDSITRGYYRGAGAAVLVFSTNDRNSYEAIPRWTEKLENECGDIALALVQNKVDLIDDATVSANEAEDLARQLNVKLYRTCVKEDINVSEVFVYLAELHDRKLALGELGAPKPKARPASPSEKPEIKGIPKEVAASETLTSNPSILPDAPQEQPAPQIEPPQSRTVDLKPSKQRAKKKKTFSSKFSRCVP